MFKISVGVFKVLNNDVAVIVNFHAEWCEPCKLLTPKLQELVVPLPGVDLATVDVESCPELVHAFEVKAVPAVIAVRSGLVVDKFIGLVDAKNIEDFIKKLSAQTRPSQSVPNN
jgi:thioredoxin 1